MFLFLHVLPNTCYYLSFLGEGNGTPLQYSCLENPMDGGAWKAAVHRVAKSRTWLSDFTFTFHFHALEKEMATHSSVLAWRIPGTGKPGWLLSMGLHRVRHDWSNLAVAADLQSSFSNVCKYQSVVVHLKLISCLCQLYFSLKKEIEGISFPPQAPRNGHVRT